MNGHAKQLGAAWGERTGESVVFGRREGLMMGSSAYSRAKKKRKEALGVSGSEAIHSAQMDNLSGVWEAGSEMSHGGERLKGRVSGSALGVRLGAMSGRLLWELQSAWDTLSRLPLWQNDADKVLRYKILKHEKILIRYIFLKAIGMPKIKVGFSQAVGVSLKSQYRVEVVNLHSIDFQLRARRAGHKGVCGEAVIKVFPIRHREWNGWYQLWRRLLNQHVVRSYIWPLCVRIHGDPVTTKYRKHHDQRDLAAAVTISWLQVQCSWQLPATAPKPFLLQQITASLELREINCQELRDTAKSQSTFLPPMKPRIRCSAPPTPTKDPKTPQMKKLWHFVTFSLFLS